MNGMEHSEEWVQIGSPGAGRPRSRPSSLTLAALLAHDAMASGYGQSWSWLVGVLHDRWMNTTFERECLGPAVISSASST